MLKPNPKQYRDVCVCARMCKRTADMTVSHDWTHLTLRYPDRLRLPSGLSAKINDPMLTLWFCTKRAKMGEKWRALPKSRLSVPIRQAYIFVFISHISHFLFLCDFLCHSALPVWFPACGTELVFVPFPISSSMLDASKLLPFTFHLVPVLLPSQYFTYLDACVRTAINNVWTRSKFLWK